MRDLRPHQSAAIDLLRSSLASGHRRPMMQAPTGFGKTLLASTIVNGALRKGKRVTFVVPALTLIDQTTEMFWSEGITDIGVIQADHPMTNPGRPIQIASVQTLERRILPPSDIVLLDEAHRWFKLYERWMTDPEWERVPFVGLSATPWTRGLGKFFDDLIVATTTEKLIDDGFLSPFKVFCPSKPDLTGVRTVAGDYHEGDLEKVMNKATLVGDVVNTWRARGEDRPTFVFAVNRAHAQSLRDRFEAVGIATAYIDAFTPREEREDIRRQFHNGDVKVVCNVGCLTVGVDWDVRCIVLARPTKSEILFCQIIGRGLRTAPGKDHLLILDHSDTHQRLGFVTDIQHEYLDDGKPKKVSAPREAEERLPKACPSCTFLKPAGLHICPVCGFAPKPQACVEVKPGELREMTAKERRARMPLDEKKQVYGQLLAICWERGYAPGWTAHKYKAFTGDWPHPKSVFDRIEPIDPTPEIRSWVKGMDIRWSKGRQKAEEREMRV